VELDLVEQGDDPGLVLLGRLAEARKRSERSSPRSAESPRPTSASTSTPISSPSGVRSVKA
jgi:hypothetical protein